MKSFLFCLQPLTIGFLAMIVLVAPLTVSGEEIAPTKKPASTAKTEKPARKLSPADIIFGEIEKLAQSEPEEDTEAAYLKHLKKIAPQIITLTEKVFALKTDEKQALRATRIKLQMLQLQTQMGEANANKQTQKFLDELAKEKRPTLVREGFIRGLVFRAGRILQMKPENRLALISDMQAFIKKESASVMSAQLAQHVASSFEEIRDQSVAGKAYADFADALAVSKNPGIQGLVQAMRGSGRRLTLPGKSIRLVGKTVAGDPFDIAKLKGKVVLVDFWATWCGPCMAEIPHLKSLYEKFHTEGLEIVGVNLDDTRGPVQAAILKNKIEWTSIFDGGIRTGKEDVIPNAEYYGVTGIPTVFLIGRDGKVVSTNAHGKLLDELIAKLIKQTAPKN